MPVDTTEKAPNRLINEKSPYLLQHAYNPVNWYPWGEEAFEKAKTEDKPIFLSIGYSTCHWCHIMEKESFEDVEVASILNQFFICIKVDREERPDIDAVYMSACQAMTGQGGWPLTIIMTPEEKPFFAGTYIPKDRKYGSVGLMELLPLVHASWMEKRKKLIASSKEIANHLMVLPKYEAADNDLDKSILHLAFTQYKNTFDQINGGFGSAPKFPAPHNLMFLLHYSQFENNDLALTMVTKTLECMYRGGIFDHIGGGFSRYSTDKKWLVPHFEKMLYDNALLAYIYLEAYLVTHQALFKTVAEKIFTYIANELTDEDGGFYCGEDADSDGIEGKYYVFTPEEIIDVLGDNQGKLFNNWYSITRAGNFEGKSIPNLLNNTQFCTGSPQAEELLPKLLAYRKNRTSLHKDDKILTSWNALMILAYSKGYQVLGKAKYLKAAQKCQDFIKNNLYTWNRELIIRWRHQDAKGKGQLNDYSFYCLSLIHLYQSTFDIQYLTWAAEFAGLMVDKFFDIENGGFFIYAEDGEQLITRPKETYDGAMPSGNSAATYVLMDLWHLTGERYWEEIALKQLQFLSGQAKQYPTSCSFALLSMMKYLYRKRELICIINDTDIIKTLPGHFRDYDLKNMAVIVKTPLNVLQLEKIAPFTKNYPFPDAGNAYYLCENHSCSTPVYAIEDIFKS